VARRIGILGGTFDPVHLGHLVLAASARDQLATDVLLLIPNYQSPLKPGQPHASFTDRMEMLKLAIEGTVGFTISDIEGRRQGVSYMIDTLDALQKQYPDDALHLIMGSDASSDLASWHESERILEMAQIAAVARSGAVPQHGSHVSETIVMPRVDISASQIRDRLARGLSIDFLTPAPVVAYIREHGLYR
jgi:nicotinate-nucleotide adenylyltransferase